MEPIHPQLVEWTNGSGPPDRRDVIVTMSPSAPWAEGLRRLQNSGLAVQHSEPQLRLVFGQASKHTVLQLATFAEVERIEPDAEADIAGTEA